MKIYLSTILNSIIFYVGKYSYFHTLSSKQTGILDFLSKMWDAWIVPSFSLITPFMASLTGYLIINLNKISLASYEPNAVLKPPMIQKPHRRLQGANIRANYGNTSKDNSIFHILCHQQRRMPQCLQTWPYGFQKCICLFWIFILRLNFIGAGAFI